jgi:lipopolysaccharide transport system ATP-binding protein
VEFGGVEKFIETPVKHYSSGMKVRLAFSVAAHLEPEILIVDEVLAVGDAEFQKKCLGKMDEVSKEEGRTILFVSHNMGAVESLCKLGFLLENGHMLENAPVGDVIIKYLQKGHAENKNGQWLFNDRAIRKVELFSSGIRTENVLSGSELSIQVEFECENLLENIVLGFTLRNSTGINIASFNNRHLGQKINVTEVRKGKISVSIPCFHIYKQDRYWIDIYLGDLNEDFDTLIGEVSFNVISSDVYNSGSVLKQEKNLLFFPNISYNFYE